MLRDRGRAIDEMLAVVEHDHRRGIGKLVGDRREGVEPGWLHHPESRGYRPCDGLPIGAGGQGGKVDEGRRTSGQGPHSQPGLTDASWSHQGHEPVLPERSTHLVELGLPANERGKRLAGPPELVHLHA